MLVHWRNSCNPSQALHNVYIVYCCMTTLNPRESLFWVKLNDGDCHHVAVGTLKSNESCPNLSLSTPLLLNLISSTAWKNNISGRRSNFSWHNSTLDGLKPEGLILSCLANGPSDSSKSVRGWGSVGKVLLFHHTPRSASRCFVLDRLNRLRSWQKTVIRRNALYSAFPSVQGKLR